MQASVGVVTLTDAGRRNAVDASSAGALARTVQEAVEAGAGAVVLRADPPVFCSGGSLDDLLDLDTDLSPLYAGFLALADCPVPTIAAVDAPCVGAGVNMPLCCDVVLTTPWARFDPLFLDVGIHPGGGHLWRLQRRVGMQGAAAMVLLGESLDGREAVERGLAWRCVEAEELMPLALRLAGRAAGRPSEVVRRAKQSLRRGAAQEEAQAVVGEAESQAWSRAQPGFVDRVLAVRERLAGAAR